jgi:hypothetical protein
MGSKSVKKSELILEEDHDVSLYTFAIHLLMKMIFRLFGAKRLMFEIVRCSFESVKLSSQPGLLHLIQLLIIEIVFLRLRLDLDCLDVSL